MVSRRLSRLFFLVFFLIMVIVLYTMLQSVNTSRNEQQSVVRTGDRLDHLEDSIRDLDKSVKQASKKQQEQPIPVPPPIIPDHEPPVQSTKKIDHAAPPPGSPSNQCAWRASSPTNTTFEIRQLYDTLPFDDVDGGVWKQGFDIKYDPTQWTSNKKLKVILMPHSHCDPGWIQTFEEYFHQSTKHIIDTIITILDSNKKYRFVWAEISFLSLWWDQASSDQRQLLKKLLNNGQLEIVTGGWVMNDEANTHYFAMLDQLIEGHQFIENNLGNITIKSGWANDPFGYSPTMAYLLRGTGMQYMAIQRVHYRLKKALAIEKRLEFVWRQAWDRSTSTEIFTHILPFYSYDIPHTCGPDPKICCQFDFKRGQDASVFCPWGINPVQINDKNVEERARTLLDQYRKKSQLYNSNVVFIQLGDDFRYTSMREAENQFQNYEKLFDYMNGRSDWNVDARFGTLSDYFEQLTQEIPQSQFPTYAGDFFTYADRSDHYWSGYYTSRAFFKRMDRIVESYLRASEILFSLANVKSFDKKLTNQFPSDHLFTMLVKARRNLAVFQHHDGVTGTAKDHVVNDYGAKLLTAITSAQDVMQESASYLLFQTNYSPDAHMLLSNVEFKTFESLPTRKLLPINAKGEEATRIIFIYNPTDQRRVEIVKILLDTHQVRVTSNKQSIGACQIDPKWSGKRSNMLVNDQFELLILVDIEPFSLKEYTIHSTPSDQSCPLATIEYVNEKEMAINSSALFKTEVLTKKTIKLSNRFLSVTFSTSGAPIHVQHANINEKIRFHVNMIRYGSTGQSDHGSGAYLFIPDGPAQDIPFGSHDLVRVQRGPLVNRIDVLHELYGLQYKLTNTNGSDDYALEIGATTHLNMNMDTEYALRFSTGIKNQAEFFTDLNGFQMIRRKTYEKLPIQGNVYPMPAMSYIEDEQIRLTILTAQPSGVACLKSGVLDAFLDRRLTRDDNRGLNQGVMDNREILSIFRVLFEPRHTIDRISLTGYPTLLAHHLSMQLLYPMHVLQTNVPFVTNNELNLFEKPSLLPADYHLVNLRSLNENRDDSKYRSSKYLALILRRFAYDCDKNYDNSFHFEQPTAEHFFKIEQIQSIEQTSLSLRSTQHQLSLTSKLHVPVAEIVTYRIRFY